MKIIGIIPARYGSTRFLGKPLVMINGKTMIQRVYEQATKALLLSEVIVATDDERIMNHVQSWGGKVMLTSLNHPSGTDRCNEIAQQINADAYINIQGDEPFIHPEQNDLLASLLQSINHPKAIATLIKKENADSILDNPNIIKVVVNQQKKALYFSRAPIPYLRNKNFKPNYYKHIGMYGYTKAALQAISQLSMSQLEQTEQLEQLRWLENGFDIFVEVTSLESHSVDVPEDLKRFENKN